jgi:DtxR family Mn-dependent transcriptional regulator
LSRHQLTAVQEDYLEIIYRLQTSGESDEVRVSDIASRLGTKLPTVTRTVRRLSNLGLLHHALRGRVTLTISGHKMAVEIVHRHEDVLTLFTDILGLDPAQAEGDACSIEHGISAATAQRLHEFLEHFAALPRPVQIRLTSFGRSKGRASASFSSLTKSRVNGWRT